MGFWPIAALVFGGALIAGFAAPRTKQVEHDGDLDCEPDYELDGSPVDAETLARLGTPDTIAELVSQGRADELRVLGYSGELPTSD